MKRALASLLTAATLTLIAAQASAQNCARMTRPLAARVASALRPGAPAWARPLLTGPLIMQYEASNLRPFTFLLGYGILSVERLGLRGAPPFSAVVVVRCRDNRAEVIADALAWANARAQELHLNITNAETAAGFAAEVMTLRAGRRPDVANATRAAGSPVFRVTVQLAPRQGETSSPTVLLDVERSGAIRMAATPTS